MASAKIKSLDALPKLLDERRGHGKIVHCHGVFDLLHVGHIRHFQEARRLGDVLVVTVTPDRYVNKGPHRPAFNESLRAEAVAALGCVDYVAVNNWPTATRTIQLLRPNLYVKGPDYKDVGKDVTGGIVLERKAVEEVGGELVITDDVSFSSSHLLNRYMPAFSEDVADFVSGFSRRYTADDVTSALESVRELKVLVAGEAIIDEYQYCETIGKSGKEPILAARYISSEKFAGGIMAVANNTAAICDEVGMLTFLGEKDSHEAFIREHLSPKVAPMFLRMKDAPTILKRRFLESYPLQKMFEVYVMNSNEDDVAMSRDLCGRLAAELPKYDVVIVTDYGHGMLGGEAVELLAEKARFLAINTQINAANHGYNTVSKYPRADYVCVSEREIRLEARSRHSPLRDVVRDVSEKLACDHVVITRGELGCLCYARNEGFAEVPALNNRVVDRIGAGDLVLSVTAPCVAAGAPMELVGFIANAVGALAVATVGHRHSIDKVVLAKFIQSLMK